ncbi:nitroreductase [Mycobacterium sp. ACS4331]|uniref:nitroreductase n=1 Tax=Mycobacterium sp. ACS4331 TaxID=1834121 RepID=UPI0007FBA013|nr:nitroreductase [Mycobacterium sp. ACS4331]OBF30469.1 nitroreductase [Mycobacterium sp. ACS4331]
MAGLPDTATLERALDTAARAPSAQNSQPWLWRVSPEGVHLYANRGRQLGDTDADRRDVLLSCGAVLDHCVVALAAHGWQTRLHRFPDSADRDHLALIEVIEAPATEPSTELAGAIPLRRADRRAYRADPIPPGTLELLAVRAARREVTLGVVPVARWARRSDDDGVVLRYGGDVAEAAADADGVLLVLGTEADDDVSRLRAGETLSRLLLSATALGLANCPLTDPLKQTRDRLALAAEVFDGDAYPQALMRLGHAPADPLPVVERLSVAETTTWDSGVR